MNRATVDPSVRLKASLHGPLVQPLLVDGVLEGGGALGAAYAGSLRALHDNGIWFARIAGNSAGAITAAMIAVGFTAPEIQWLSSAFPGASAAPPSLSALGIRSPISFADFLDLPRLNSISQSSKRKTLLWQALKGSIIDEIGKLNVPVPIQSDVVNASFNAIMADGFLGNGIRLLPGEGAEATLKTVIDTTLSPLPDRQLKVRDFLPNTEALRTAFADTIWDAIGRNDPLLLLMTNLIHEGSLFEGNVFLHTLRRLFGQKVYREPNATVLFKDLKIPLAIIAANIETGTMIVYNSKDHPNMEVAEAVRQSMSVPFVFQPRGRKGQMVDGGLFSNFPVWLYTAGGDRYWNQNVVDANRIKIGISLNDKLPAKNQWNTKPARFRTPVDTLEVVKPLLVEKMVEIGVSRNVAEAKITWALFGALENAVSQPGVALLKQAVEVMFNGLMNTEESVRQVTTGGLMNGRRYVDISIPLLGYSAADFFINEDEGAALSMWDRAWHATIESLTEAKTKGFFPPAMQLQNTQTPFN